MIKLILLIIGIESLFTAIAHAQTLNDTDSTENITEIMDAKPFIYYGRYHQRRPRREDSSTNTTSDLDILSTILSILPLDRLGAIIGQIMATSLKEILNPNVGKKIIHVLENQVPALLTSLFTNLFSTFRLQARSTTNNMTISIDRNDSKLSSNSSTPSFMNFMRRPRTK